MQLSEDALKTLNYRRLAAHLICLERMDERYPDAQTPLSASQFVDDEALDSDGGPSSGDEDCEVPEESSPSDERTSRGCLRLKKRNRSNPHVSARPTTHTQPGESSASDGDEDPLNLPNLVLYLSQWDMSNMDMISLLAAEAARLRRLEAVRTGRSFRRGPYGKRAKVTDRGE